MIERAFKLLALVLVLGYFAVACGRTNEGGEGSETHWLSPCSSSSECELGECLCGVCTRSCSSVRDCPAALDVCLADSPQGAECAQSICQLSSGSPGLSPAAAPTLDRLETCEGGRPLLLRHADDAGFEGPIGNHTRVVPDGTDGFLLFGQTFPGFLRLSPAGDVVRLLPQPAFEQAASIDHVVTLADGSLLLAGTVGQSQLEHAWLGKLDSNWNPEWEYELELDAVERADLVALPDGGAVVAGVRWLDRGNPAQGADDDVFLARLSAAGELMWEQRFSFESTHSFSEQYGFRVLASTAEGVQLVVPTDDAVYRVLSDLDGNVDPDSLVTALPPDAVSPISDAGQREPIGIEALPDGSYALYSPHRVAVLDAAGEVVLHFDVEAFDAITAARFDEQRGELVVAGQYNDPSVSELPGPWVRALGLDGELSWQFRRPGLNLDPQGKLQADADSAPPLADAAIDGRGNMLMTGHIGRGLEWVSVGGESCGG